MPFRHSVRALLNGRGATAIALLALALGIGANTAVFSVVRAVLLQPLPYREPGRLVSILQAESNPLGYDDFTDIRARAKSFSQAGAAELWSASLAGQEAPEQILGMRVTQDLFGVLAVLPVRGRLIDASDFEAGKPRALVLSYGLWQRAFGGANDIIGRAVTLDGASYTVVGVMPRGFYFAPFWVTQAEMWTTLDLRAGGGGRRGGGSLRAFARLAGGVDLPRAQTELNGIAASLAAAYPDFDSGVRLVAESLPEKAVGKVRPVLQLMLAAVGMVLLIACANVANLALARATSRTRETAVRIALGAGRGRIVRQFLAENLLLSVCGGALGVLLAHWGVAALQSALQTDPGATRGRLLQADRIALDGLVLLFALLLSAVTGLLSGVVPALSAWRAALNPALKEGSRGLAQRRSTFRSALVAAEIAIAVVLVSGAGLLMRSFLRLRTVDPGFDPRNLVTMRISVAGRPDYTGMRRDVLYREILDRVAAVPGVARASMINHLPIAGDEWGYPWWVEGAPLPRPDKIPIAVFRVCRPNYFATMGARILAGRDFTDRDGPDAPAVAMVNETLAKRIGNAMGKRISFSDPRRSPKWMTIVGVVRDLAQSWADPAAPEMYVPYLQQPELRNTRGPAFAYMTLVARTNSDAASFVQAVETAVRQVDRSLPLSEVQTLEHAIGNATWGPRFSLGVAAAFSSLALLLAMIGIYGVMSYEVAQRTHEIGIRMALGAGAPNVLRLVARQCLAVAIVGAGCGIAAAAALSRLMRAMLYQIDPLDPVTFGSVAALMLAVAAAAAIIPARRAIRVDPVIALRVE